MSVDKAYSIKNALSYIDSIGGTAYVPFRSNATGKSRGSYTWMKMYGFFTFNRYEFMQHYHILN